MSERGFGREGQNNRIRRVVSRRAFLALSVGGVLSFGSLFVHGRGEWKKLQAPLQEFDKIEQSKKDAARYQKPYSLEQIQRINESGVGLTPKQEQLLDNFTKNIAEMGRIKKESTIGASGAIVAIVLTAAHFFVPVSQERDR